MNLIGMAIVMWKANLVTNLKYNEIQNRNIATNGRHYIRNSRHSRPVEMNTGENNAIRNISFYRQKNKQLKQLREKENNTNGISINVIDSDNDKNAKRSSISITDRPTFRKSTNELKNKTGKQQLQYGSGGQVGPPENDYGSRVGGEGIPATPNANFPNRPESATPVGPQGGQHPILPERNPAGGGSQPPVTNSNWNGNRGIPGNPFGGANNRPPVPGTVTVNGNNFSNTGGTHSRPPTVQPGTHGSGRPHESGSGSGRFPNGRPTYGYGSNNRGGQQPHTTQHDHSPGNVNHDHSPGNVNHDHSPGNAHRNHSPDNVHHDHSPDNVHHDQSGYSPGGYGTHSAGPSSGNGWSGQNGRGTTIHRDSAHNNPAGGNGGTRSFDTAGIGIIRPPNWNGPPYGGEKNNHLPPTASGRPPPTLFPNENNGQGGSAGCFEGGSVCNERNNVRPQDGNTFPQDGSNMCPDADNCLQGGGNVFPRRGGQNFPGRNNNFLPGTGVSPQNGNNFPGGGNNIPHGNHNFYPANTPHNARPVGGYNPYGVNYPNSQNDDNYHGNVNPYEPGPGTGRGNFQPGDFIGPAGHGNPSTHGRGGGVLPGFSPHGNNNNNNNQPNGNWDGQNDLCNDCNFINRGTQTGRPSSHGSHPSGRGPNFGFTPQGGGRSPVPGRRVNTPHNNGDTNNPNGFPRDNGPGNDGSNPNYIPDDENGNANAYGPNTNFWHQNGGFPHNSNRGTTGGTNSNFPSNRRRPTPGPRTHNYPGNTGRRPNYRPNNDGSSGADVPHETPTDGTFHNEQGSDEDLFHDIGHPKSDDTFDSDDFSGFLGDFDSDENFGSKRNRPSDPNERPINGNRKKQHKGFNNGWKHKKFNLHGSSWFHGDHSQNGNKHDAGNSCFSDEDKWSQEDFK